MSTIPEPLRKQIDEAAKTSRNMNVPNNDDPAEDYPPAADDVPTEDEGRKENR